MKYVYLLLASILLSGCGALNMGGASDKAREVEEYNQLLGSTLSFYVEAKKTAVDNKTQLLDYIFNDKDWTMLTDSEISYTKLTEEEKKSFEVKGVLQDTYFTALGATGVREVLIITGSEHIAHITVLWDKEGVVSLDKKVKPL